MSNPNQTEMPKPKQESFSRKLKSWVSLLRRQVPVEPDQVIKAIAHPDHLPTTKDDGAVPNKLSLGEQGRVNMTEHKKWVDGLSETPDHPGGIIRNPLDDGEGFYDKQHGGFTFWRLGKGQNAAELLRILLQIREEENKLDMDSREIQELSRTARKLSEPKPDDSQSPSQI